MSTLDEIRAKLAQMENKTSGTPRNDNAVYPFWNIQEGDTAVLRFLPDEDPDNVFFWVERQVIKLPFPGIKGGEHKAVTVQVPCGEMYGDNCPVLTQVRPWFKDASMEDLGRKYWKKRSYIFQGFVLEDPMNEEATENPIRRFVIGPQIFNIIKSALMDPDMDNIPTDYVNGTDFRLAKTAKGQYADYSTSKWARKERSLDENELAAIDQFGLYDLKTFLPSRPTTEQYGIIEEMFEASVNGEMYDPDRWAEHYRPYGMENPNKDAPQVQTPAPAAQQTAPAPASAPAPAESAAEAAAEPGKKSADDILAMIRNRKTAE